MRLLWTIWFSWIALITCPALVWAAADGGVLYYIPDAALPSDLRYNLSGDEGLANKGEATVTFPDGASREVRIFENQDKKRFYTTQEAPYRLWFDTNSDGQAQQAELINTHNDAVDETRQVFKLTMDVPVAGATVPVSLQAMIQDKQFMRFYQKSGYYRGVVAAGTQEYFVKMYLTSLFPPPGEINGSFCFVASLLGADTEFNLDDEGYYRSSELVSCTGSMMLNNAFWDLATIGFGATAQVNLTPYAGPLGAVAVTGMDVSRLTLNHISPEKTRRGENRRQGNQETYRIQGIEYGVKERFTFRRVSAGYSYQLPAGKYIMRGAQLDNDQDENNPLWITPKNGVEQSFELVENSTYELALGGPYRGKLKARLNKFTGLVFLGRDNYVNQTGYMCSPYLKGWLVLNARKQPVAQGKFEYG